MLSTTHLHMDALNEKHTPVQLQFVKAEPIHLKQVQDALAIVFLEKPAHFIL